MLLGDEVGLRGDGSEHSASRGRTWSGVRRGRPDPTGRAGCGIGGPEYPTRDAPTAGRATAQRSPFAAAFLSLIFPGLGQLYAGAPSRALAFAAAPILLVALLAGIVLRLDRIELVGLVFNPFAAELGLRVQRRRPALPAGRDRRRLPGRRVPQLVRRRRATVGSGPARIPRNPLSIAGLLAVVLVMTGSHVVVARYDMLALRPARERLHLHQRPDEPRMQRRRDAGARTRPRTRRRPPSPSRAAVGGAVPDVSVPPWDGKERLNILLIGTDQRPERRHVQHRHADRRLDRPGHQAGRRCSACRATRSTCPIPPGPRAAGVRPGLHAEDQRLVDLDSQPRRTSSRARTGRAATTGSRRSWATSTGSTSSTSSRSTSRASSRSSTRWAA